MGGGGPLVPVVWPVSHLSWCDACHPVRLQEPFCRARTVWRWISDLRSVCLAATGSESVNIPDLCVQYLRRRSACEVMGGSLGAPDCHVIPLSLSRRSLKLLAP